MFPRRILFALMIFGLAIAPIAFGCGGSKGGGSGSAINNQIVLDPPAGSTLPSGTVATVYTETFTVTRGGVPPFTFTAITLPPGITLQPVDATAVAIQGTPTQAGPSLVTFQVIDSTQANATNASYNLTIK